MKLLTIATTIACLPLLHAAQLANGFKVGEVDSNSATVWTRTTQDKEAQNRVGKFNVNAYTLKKNAELPWQVPGATGEVKITYHPKNTPQSAIETKWLLVDPKKDFTKRIELTKLIPNTEYSLTVESRKPGTSTLVATKKGGFITAPDKTSTAPVNFTVTTCQGFFRRDTNGGHKIYPSMLALKPKFLVHTGDVLYYDKPGPLAKNETLARYKWNRIYALPKLRNFHQNVSCYYQKDDHDIIKNDAWPGQKYGDLTFAQGLAIFEEQTPFPMGKPYRTIRWGKDLQIWLMEGRDFRSPNNLPNPKKRTIWGEEQLNWLETTLSESDAAIKLVISPTPIVGPDRTKGKNDNHANKSHKYEGDKVRELLSKQKAISICGDRHWQYASFDPKTGLKEFGCGPASDIHASGYKLTQRKNNHTYLKICGGFLQVKTERINGVPQATFIHHSVDGNVNSSKTLTFPVELNKKK